MINSVYASPIHYYFFSKVCHDGVVVGHRLVLGAASTTLRAALQQVSPSPANDEAEPDTYTVIVPDVKKNIVASLVDFLYTVSHEIA